MSLILRFFCRKNGKMPRHSFVAVGWEDCKGNENGKLEIARLNVLLLCGVEIKERFEFP